MMRETSPAACTFVTSQTSGSSHSTEKVEPPPAEQTTSHRRTHWSRSRSSRCSIDAVKRRRRLADFDQQGPLVVGIAEFEGLFAVGRIRGGLELGRRRLRAELQQLAAD